MALKPIVEKRTINNIISITGKNGIILKDDDSGNVLDSFYYEQSDSKRTLRFIKSVEKLVRSSDEYSHYLGYLHGLGLTQDVLMNNITDEEVTTEYHHYPFTLYDITEILLNKCLKENIKITSISLAEMVMKEHYENTIGLVKLTKTNHELVHAGKLFVPLKSVFGDVNKFVKKYKDYIFDDVLKKYNDLIDIDTKGSYVNELYSEGRISNNMFKTEDL